MRESSEAADGWFGAVRVQSYTCTLGNYTTDLTVFTLVPLADEQLTESAFIESLIFTNRKRILFPFHLI